MPAAKGFNMIYYVEDDDNIRDLTVYALRKQGIEAEGFSCDGEFKTAVARRVPDAVLLDIMLPVMDGWSVLRTIRQDSKTPVIMLTAKGETNDKVQGLKQGADDYLTKPFHLDELAARIRSLTLRRFTQSDVVLTCDELSFDTKARTASVRGETLSLTRKETGILEYLLLHQGRPVSQEELLEHVWDSGADGFGNSIRVHISALRKKLRAALGYDPIRNRIGEGYVMEAQT